MQRVEVATGLRAENICTQSVVRVLAVQEHSAEGGRDLLWAHLLPVLGHVPACHLHCTTQEVHKGKDFPEMERKMPLAHSQWIKLSL